MNEAIQIYVRMRPLLSSEDEEAWRVQKESNSILSMPRDPQTTRRYADAFYNYNFTFDKVFSAQENTEFVYQSCKPLLYQTLQGFNASLFLYGQTTSGKTYTMLGDQANPGILPFVLLDIFKESPKPKAISYIEIYNEQINDLLQVGATNLKMIDANGCAQVPLLKQAIVDNFEDALNLLCFGEEQRCYREKQIHEHSSRSHTIFQITIQHETHSSVLSLIDLAGSERLNEEDATDETAYINKSLFVLSNVINKLAEGKRTHIPYRDSKLTRYLQNSLGGNSFTTIICAISPASMNFNQTLSTLRFAQRAKKVQNKVFKNENKLLSSQEQLLKEIQELKQERDTLLKQQQSRTGENYQADLFIAFMAQQVTQEKKQFLEDAQILKEHFEKQQTLLEQQFFSAIIQTSKLDFKPIEPRGAFVGLMKDSLQKAIETETVFNNVYVQSILNPTNSSDFQAYQTEELLSLLQQAYQEANQALQQKLAETYTLLDQIAQANIQKYASIKDESSYKQYSQFLNQEFLWVKQAKTTLHEQLQKKLTVLSQAFQNVQKNLAVSETRKSFASATTSQAPSLHINNLPMHHHRNSSTPTPKFTDRFTQIFVWGSGKDGRLGTGNQLSQPVPCLLSNTTNYNFNSVSCGYYHTAAIDHENNLFVWGKTPIGPQLIPLQLLQNVQQVACGWSHTLALLQNGQVLSWGVGDEGQLGHGNYNSSGQPKVIEQLKDVLFVAAGHSHSGAILVNNDVYMWGCNIDNRLLIKETSNFNTPQNTLMRAQKISLGANHTGLVTLDSTVIMGGCGSSGQLGKQEADNMRLVRIQMKVNDVACGEDLTLFLNKAGEVFSCGKKSNGTLGHPMNEIPATLCDPKRIEQLSKISKISVGKRHCLAVSLLKEVWGWGFNFYDQLGLGDRNKFAETPLKLDLQEVTAVSCGEYHSLALCSS